MTIADIYEAVYLCTYDTTIANAFRKACGFPVKQPREQRAVPKRKSSYADVDWEHLMTERRGVRL